MDWKLNDTITSWEIVGETVETVSDVIFGAPKSLQMVISAMKLKTFTPWKESCDPPRQHVKVETLLCQQRSV